MCFYVNEIRSLLSCLVCSLYTEYDFKLNFETGRFTGPGKVNVNPQIMKMIVNRF